MAHEFRHKLRVEFADTDLAGIAHFSNFFRYMEVTEHAFLRSLGLSVHTEIDGRVISWPRVGARCSYLAPLRFEDEFEVRLLVRSKRSKSIVYEHWFYGEAGRPVAHGRVTVVCAALDTATGRMAAIPIPPAIGDKIQTAPDSLLKRSSRRPAGQ